MADDTNRMQNGAKDVRHVPEVRLNLISADRLDDEGYTGSIRNGAMKFSKGSLIVARPRKVNTLDLMNARKKRTLLPTLPVSCGTRDCVT